MKNLTLFIALMMATGCASLSTQNTIQSNQQINTDLITSNSEDIEFIFNQLKVLIEIDNQQSEFNEIQIKANDITNNRIHILEMQNKEYKEIIFWLIEEIRKLKNRNM